MIKLILFALFLASGKGKYFKDGNTENMHPFPSKDFSKIKLPHPSETTEFWFNSAQDTLRKKIADEKPIEKQAKNIVFFLGDGMGVSTVTAARIHKGQLAGSTRGGEETQLFMEKFSNLGAAKTYCTTIAIADSACSATAFLTGTKANLATIGLNVNVNVFNCWGQMDPENHVTSILQWMQESGRSTGIVTTQTVTHATPAAAYAHSAFRNWETDSDIRDFIVINPDTCDDIAEQLILKNPGNKINVILGGGRTHFLSEPSTDIETGELNKRKDGKDLISDWMDSKAGSQYHYVSNRDELLAIDTEKTDNLLGLFAPGSMAFNNSALERNDPLLSEMTRVAIEILSKNPNGFFLLVEGGKIDSAHHSNNARLSLEETIEFDRAIEVSSEMISDDDTLTIVTADHSHVLTFGGYADRGKPILGLTGNLLAEDFLPFTSLQYANGPGYRKPVPSSSNSGSCSRADHQNDDYQSYNYKHMTAVPLGSETHGGEDVFVFSKGPFAHLLKGVYEQNYIAHVMGYASCTGPFDKFCEDSSSSTDGPGSDSSASRLPFGLFSYIYLIILGLLF